MICEILVEDLPRNNPINQSILVEILLVVTEEMSFEVYSIIFVALATMFCSGEERFEQFCWRIS